jgi:hypothetical protein
LRKKLELKIGNDFLPLHPHTLISLLDMVHIYIIELKMLLFSISDREEHLRNYPPTTDERIHEVAESLIDFVKRISTVADKLKLVETGGCCSRFLRALDNSIHPIEFPKGNKMIMDSFTPQELVRELKGIGDAADKELSQIKFAFIPTAKDKFFDRDDLFGKSFHDSAAPEMNSEIKAAGNCLAADLNTAAVFHLMRVAELGMRTNLSMRTFTRRFTRCTIGYSKKLENHKSAVALFVWHFNFCRVHSAHGRTPAQECGLVSKAFSIEDLLADNPARI